MEDYNDIELSRAIVRDDLIIMVVDYWKRCV